ncbi:MAG: lipid-A-disaccharide synthase [Acidobacteria bacterium]|nr:lipid-A-disaccharide synthase [Acidobacteriota bacterium]
MEPEIDPGTASDSDRLRILMVAAEVSGDQAGAFLASAIRAACPGTHMFGIGGRRMEAAGVRIDYQAAGLGVVGIQEVLRVLPSLCSVLRTIRRMVKLERPHIAVLIGYEGFNVPLARWLKRSGIRTVAYLPPQVWIWKTFARPIGRSFDLVLASFPEELRIYAAAGARAVFVGHYLSSYLLPLSSDERRRLRASFEITPEERLVGLLPGSRLHEIRRFAPLFLEAACRLHETHRELRFVLPLSEPSHQEIVRREIQKVDGVPGLHVQITEDSHQAMRCCDLILTASGTATLEAALLGIPMVVVYRVSALSYLIIRAAQRSGLLCYSTIALPNLLSGKEIVPELQQRRANRVELVAAASQLLGDPFQRGTTAWELSEIRRLVCEKTDIALTLRRVLPQLINYRPPDEVARI